MKDKITLALGNILNSEFTENKNPPIKFGSILANLDRYYVLFMTFGIESFTSLMENVRQDIKRVSFKKHFLLGIALLRQFYIN